MVERDIELIFANAEWFVKARCVCRFSAIVHRSSLHFTTSYYTRNYEISKRTSSYIIRMYIW